MSITFFYLASSINLKYIFVIFLKRKTNKNLDDEFLSDENEISSAENKDFQRSQQTFEFGKVSESATKVDNNISYKNYKLPSIDLLEKNTTKMNLQDLNKNKPDASFIEKILLDFGIDGSIKKINNGPVVSLYEFEPAPGVKISKIINLSDDIARNTSSVSARVSTIPGKYCWNRDS